MNTGAMENEEESLVSMLAKLHERLHAIKEKKAAAEARVCRMIVFSVEDWNDCNAIAYVIQARLHVAGPRVILVAHYAPFKLKRETGPGCAFQAEPPEDLIWNHLNTNLSVSLQIQAEI